MLVPTLAGLQTNRAEVIANNTWWSNTNNICVHQFYFVYYLYLFLILRRHGGPLYICHAYILTRERQTRLPMSQVSTHLSSCGGWRSGCCLGQYFAARSPTRISEMKRRKSSNSERIWWRRLQSCRRKTDERTDNVLFSEQVCDLRRRGSG